MNQYTLLDRIEACREEMISASAIYELTSEPVISSSTELDKLINEYQKHLYVENGTAHKA